MHILRTSAASPYGRKVRMAIEAVGKSAEVRIVPADTNDPADSLRSQNPLGKVPVLIREDGEALFDSRVIVDYLNAIDGRDILIPAGAARMEVLRQQALADGLLDAALLQVYEKRFRPPTHQLESWVAIQRGKVDRTLDFIAQRLPAAQALTPHIGEISLAAALGYLDLRFERAWRSTHPGLAEWLQAFAQRFAGYDRSAPDMPLEGGAAST